MMTVVALEPESQPAVDDTSIERSPFINCPQAFATARGTHERVERCLPDAG